MTTGLAALGRYDEAIKYAEAALLQAPDEVNKKSLASMIEKLKSKQDSN
ncbi:MAG: hypothetical protein M3R25_03130 [Bacteroidota bacterium]|nr:hypothetical protein [Bacteroidota bacterium]